MERTTEKISVFYVKSPSRWGEALFRQVQELLENFALKKQKDAGARFEIEIFDAVNESQKNGKYSGLKKCQQAAMCACFYEDIVIFDGSIEDNRHDQYRFAYDLMKRLDHVLIVSRTELPYNFEGRRRDGASSWIRIGEASVDLDVLRDPVQLNAGIIKWLNHTLEQLELPRSNKLVEQLRFDNVMAETIKAINISDKRMNDFDKSALFVSYLSKDYAALKKCFSYIEERTGLKKDNFHYFAPGRVAEEFMTEQRRWEIVSITDREMSKCGSLLIFETEGYFRSWWTVGELISVSYRFHKKWRECPTVYVANVRLNGKEMPEIIWKVLDTPEQKQNFFPKLSEYQMRRLARRFVNSDPDEAAYELDEKSIRESQLPAPAKIPLAIFKGGVISIAEQNGWLGDSSEKNTLSENISRAWESGNSYANTKEFRTKRIVECRYCRENASDLTVDNFIQLDMPHMRRVDAQEIVECEDGTMILPDICPVHGSIRLKKNGHYYRFIQPRRGKLMKKGKTLIEYIDRIDVMEQ